MAQINQSRKTDKKNTSPQFSKQQTMVAIAGPLPPPSILQDYEKIHPGLAERIVRMAEQQGEHRRNIEQKALDAQINHELRIDKEYKRAQIFAFIIVVGGMVVGSMMLKLGLTIMGTIFAGGPLAAIVIAFLKGRWFKLKDQKMHINPSMQS